MATERMLWRAWAASLLSCALTCGVVNAAPAGAQGDAFVYVVEPGDTLLTLATRYMDTQEGWRVLQRINRVADPYRLVPGSKILIPFSRIPETVNQALVVYTKGDVRVAGRPIEVGARLVESDRIETGANASVTLELADRTRVTLPPQTVVQVQRVRSFTRARLIDAVFSIEKGSADARVAPERNGVGRFEIHTPLLVTGVRGTRYRVSAVPGSVRSEVLEGQVGISTPVSRAGPTAVNAGYGVSTGPKGALSKPVRLLAPPSLDPLPSLVLGSSTQVSWSAVPGATSYMTTVARDIDLTEIVWTGTGSVRQATIDDLPDGQLYVAVSAISSAGLVGFATTAPIKVRTHPAAPLTLQPASEHTQYGDVAQFEWATAPDAALYEIELAQDAGFLTGRSAWTTAETRTSRPLEPGHWWWRVRSVDRAGDAGPWSDPIGFWIEPPGPIPRSDDDGNTLSISWPKGRAASATAYRVQLATDVAFASVVSDTQVTTNELQIPRPQAGVYYVRVARLPEDGTLNAAAFSTPQRFQLKEFLRDGTGQAVAVGQGGSERVRLDHGE